MVKVLAAEMSDPSRHRKGKQYAIDGSILDIIIEPGIVTCEIQGSRSMPYVASIEVLPGSGMPLRRDLTCSCSCPDDDNWSGHACKHVVAALYTLSNEFLIEPELLDVWRDNSDGTHTADKERTDLLFHNSDSGSDRDHDSDMKMKMTTILIPARHAARAAICQSCAISMTTNLHRSRPRCLRIR